MLRSFSGIQEQSDEFLRLFPHRFDYIYADHVQPGESPQWRTESRHPLSDRLIQQGGSLFGVRFGSHTQYCLLDIDIDSAYHPKQDPLAISRIVAALESIGLVAHIACTSSYSGGIHLYFPLGQPQSSWQLAIALATLLENAGFKLKPGQLEIFPNPKPYSVEGNFSLFNAHRLPMQIGSYLLNRDFQPMWSDRQQFVQQWQLVEQQNQLETSVLKQVIKQAKRQLFRVSGKADKFINDLNAEIEFGWTGAGQTNRLLGRIAMRCYIFHHLLFGGEPLSGQALVDEIVKTARSLPGYQEWCQHQHEIEKRATEWARCIENSHYFHYGDTKGKFKAAKQEHSQDTESALEQLPTWNQQQSLSTREKIRRAIADLLEKNSLSMTVTTRFKQLVSYGIGGGSLYRHKDLWHPEYLTEESPPEESQEVLVGLSSTKTDLELTDLELTDSKRIEEKIDLAVEETSINNPVENNLATVENLSGITNLITLDFRASESLSKCHLVDQYSPSLFSTSGGNFFSGKASSDRISQNSQLTGRNLPTGVVSALFTAPLRCVPVAPELNSESLTGGSGGIPKPSMDAICLCYHLQLDQPSRLTLKPEVNRGWNIYP